jgi:hypothetical protein
MAMPAVEILSEPEEAPPAGFPISSAETAECTCPDWCERDHDRD